MRFLFVVGIILFFALSYSHLSLASENEEVAISKNLAEEYFIIANTYRINNHFDSAMYFAIKSLRTLGGALIEDVDGNTLFQTTGSLGSRGRTETEVVFLANADLILDDFAKIYIGSHSFYGD